jgi:hypothetical protein
LLQYSSEPLGKTLSFMPTAVPGRPMSAFLDLDQMHSISRGDT